MAKMRKTETTALDWDEFVYLKKALAKDLTVFGERAILRTAKAKLAAGIVTGCYVGLRYSDLSKLTWRQIVGNTTLKLKEGKTGKEREIQINKTCHDFVERCWRECENINGDEPIISNRWGQSMSGAWFNGKLKETLARFNIETQNASSHLLRKTFGRRVYQNAGESHESLLLLMRIFNHSSTYITAKYIGIDREMIKRAYVNLD